jgi:hypothetical protein
MATACRINSCVCNDSSGNPIGTPVENSNCSQNGANECKSCNAGYILNSSTKRCEPCPENHYRSVGDTSCSACQAYEHSSRGSASVSCMLEKEF